MPSKKNLPPSSLIPKTYQPGLYEDQLYKIWEDSGFFNPDNLDLPLDAPPYTIILPPPNVTDVLHLGHSSMLAIQDLLIRFHRMNGYKTLWLPGTDHASIATQNAVEKLLLSKEGKTRHEIGREKFLEKVWQFLNETQSKILYQTKKMGSSLDWSRQAFTLDDTRVKAVRKLFVDMYREGIIYRGERIINWCPRCKSTLADDEIEYQPQKSVLYTFKYDQNFPFAIATTRPETKLGDTAVAVNPKDKRYAPFIGKTFTANFLGTQLTLKIIGDWKVDLHFGTGALGVTPAHSMTDWQMAESHQLPVIKVIGEDAKINPNFGEFSGLSIHDARQKIVKQLEKNGLLIDQKPLDHNLSTCYRCGTSIEPLPSKQWFVNVDQKLKRLGNKSLKDRAVEAATTGQIKFTPKRFTKRYLDWINNLHDWCISRQIWFGHQVPVYYRGEEVFVGENKPEGQGWTQDPDTLDTWFSSGMWTFSTLGWPQNFINYQKTGDLAKFHPTQMLETGHEIITLWVSRMIIMSLFALNEIPFQNVYLHGLILDKTGKKMSKSKGNGIDPLDVIKSYGTDAVRLSLLIGSTPGNDIRFYEDKILKHQNYVNKIWNIARYIISNYQINRDISQNQIDPSDLTDFDRWILTKTQTLIKEVTSDLKKYKFSRSGEKLYNFTWNDLADWYLEVCKFEKNKSKPAILSYILTTILKLHHPFTPFVTEKIWSFLHPNQKENLLLVAPWPKVDSVYTKLTSSSNIDLVQQIIIAIRNARSANKIDPSLKIKAVIYAGKNSQFIKSQDLLITSLKTGLHDLEIKDSGPKIDQAIYVSVKDIEIYLIIPIDKTKETARLKKEIQNLTNLVDSQQTRLQNKDFTAKAPPQIVAAQKANLQKLTTELKNLTDRLKNL